MRIGPCPISSPQDAGFLCSCIIAHWGPGTGRHAVMDQTHYQSFLSSALPGELCAAVSGSQGVLSGRPRLISAPRRKLSISPSWAFFFLLFLCVWESARHIRIHGFAQFFFLDPSPRYWQSQNSGRNLMGWIAKTPRPSAAQLEQLFDKVEYGCLSHGAGN